MNSAFYERLFELSPDAILVTDLQGRIVSLNAQAEQMFGYSRDELLGKVVEVLMPARFQAAHALARCTYAMDPHPRPMGSGIELYGRRKDGSEFPADIMLGSIRTEDDSLALAVVRDTTMRRRAREALRWSEERFRLLVDDVKDYAIFMLDAEGRVMSWNTGAERVTGYAADEIIDQHFSIFHTLDDVERGRPGELLHVAASRGRAEDEGWRVRKDGSRFWVSVALTALRDGAGALRGFSTVTRDISERKRAEEALLLELTSVLLANLDIRKLLSAISASLRHVAPHEYASLALFDPALNKLRFQALSSPQRLDLTPEEMLIPVEGTPAGLAFSTRQPLVVDRLDSRRFPGASIRHLLDMGVKAGCWLPLISGDRVLGTLSVASLREGAYAGADLSLLTQAASRVASAIDNAVAFKQIAELNDRLAEEKQYLEDELRTEYNFEEIVGESAALKRVLKQAETVAPTDATVLIQGETGTGKELIARAIHELSGRKGRTFVKLNCAAIPAGLLESEIFGHERGAFTGAFTQKLGRLELAHRGTFFLDEVGDLPLELQPKLLRALQEKEFERVGGTRTIPVDVRLVAATNQDLEKMVNDHQFRSDLYYRLRVIPLTIPPLRERPEDIPILAHYFAQKHSNRMNKRIEGIPRETLRRLSLWHWPGNVRELENVIERAVILARGPELEISTTELQGRALNHSVTPAQTLEDAERECILRALREARGIVGGPHGAAARLGLKRTTLNFKMRKLGISRKDI